MNCANLTRLVAPRKSFPSYLHRILDWHASKGGGARILCYKEGERLAADASLAKRVRSERKQP